MLMVWIRHTNIRNRYNRTFSVWPIQFRKFCSKSSFRLSSYRESPFSDVRRDTTVENSSIGNSTLVASRIDCGMLCVQEPKCLSYTLCAGRVCTLHNISAFHPDFESKSVTDPKCIYAGMEKDQYPTCREKGQKVSIRDDSTTSKYKINLKRIDGKLSELQEVDGMRLRLCTIGPLHGGKPCPAEEFQLMLKTRVYISEAKAICSHFGAEIFDDFANRAAVLTILGYMGRNAPFWTGIHKVDGVWVDNDGKEAEGVYWRINHPTEQEESSLTIINLSYAGYHFFNVPPTFEYGFACQQRHSP